ncbi:hypothetical protein CANARDRAFT_26918 [[Candida] arabinofermentans NRRL YB-2248]|uniref:SAC domain-containing protein n=1 Tax=[Candida] arabinofermentans NRRL YB-2248 TaxID=983967 RepID=A0A1E4T6Y0_9ASCO|nr:hypothetical protein CANARDRAFT_26918 [[Candida] arabinofermentans NRRL YB-2248]
MVSSTSLSIAETESGYVVVLPSSESSKALLVTNTGSCEFIDKEKYPVNKPFRSIAGIIGIIHLHTNHYLITADGASEVGRVIQGQKICKVTAFSILPLSASKYQVDSDETKYLELLKSHLNNATLFFSYNYDLTKPYIKQNEAQIDDKFMWNYFVSQDLFKLASIDPFANNFILPCIYGYSKFVTTTINSKRVTFGLITRRSRLRAGTRYFRRGIDEEGNVANFNETEQLLIIHRGDEDHVHSYLQIRGSVPVFWAELNNLKYKPNLLMGPSDYTATRHHFNQSVTNYGTNYLVNLVNQKGYEMPVKLAYENAVTALDDKEIKYTYFDFHHECRNMRWHRVKLLIDHLTEIGLSNKDYSAVTVTEKFIVTKKQSHVVRTNCMDCLDRTNVVQSMMGRYFLQSQLTDSGIITGQQDWEIIDPAFNLIFMNIWADNADAVSSSYSGTGALKTDFTRTGSRTKAGALNDLVNSITRYIKNNYKDGPRQDGYDLFLGNTLPYENATSPFQDMRPSSTQAMPYGLMASLFILVTTIMYPNGSLFESRNFAFLSLVSAIAAYTFKTIVSQGVQYVNWPKLCPLDYLTSREMLNDGKFNGVLFEKAESYNKFTLDNKKE